VLFGLPWARLSLGFGRLPLLSSGLLDLVARLEEKKERIEKGEIYPRYKHVSGVARTWTMALVRLTHRRPFL
jgi:hypothetical protein